MSEGMAYIARKPCGCVVYATAANPDHVSDWSKDLAAMAKRGLEIEHVTVESARSQFTVCDHD